MTSTQSTGSLVNLVAGSRRNAEPEVGMGVTILSWTDRTAGTISAVVNPKTIRVQEDKATRTDSNGMSESQTYDYEPQPGRAGDDLHASQGRPLGPQG